MKTESLVKKHLPFEIPETPEGDERRKVFREIQQTILSDPALSKEHNTCASSEIDIRSVEFNVKEDDLTLNDTE